MPPFIVRLIFVFFLPLILFMVIGATQQKFFAGFLPPILLLCYFYPTFEAYLHESDDLLSVGIVNLFLGWTFIGWVVALVWAVKGAFKKSTEASPVTQVIQLHTGGGDFSRISNSESESVERKTRSCPYCAEEIMVEAILCKHCKSDLRDLPKSM